MKLSPFQTKKKDQINEKVKTLTVSHEGLRARARLVGGINLADFRKRNRQIKRDREERTEKKRKVSVLMPD